MFFPTDLIGRSASRVWPIRAGFTRTGLLHTLPTIGQPKHLQDSLSLRCLGFRHPAPSPMIVRTTRPFHAPLRRSAHGVPSWNHFRTTDGSWRPFMPFPLTPSPRRDSASAASRNPDQPAVSGPSSLHSPEPLPLHDSPRQSRESTPAPAPCSGTACGSRSTRPTGTR